MARVYDKKGQKKPSQNKATGPKEKKEKPDGANSGDK